MAHFAELDENNVVQRVLVVDNNILLQDGVEREDNGIQYLKSLFGVETNWKQTSYNNNFRKHYAGEGFTYDPARDAFIPPKYFNSWILDPITLTWNSPVPYPEDGYEYAWDEDTVSWIKVDECVECNLNNGD